MTCRSASQKLLVLVLVHESEGEAERALAADGQIAAAGANQSAGEPSVAVAEKPDAREWVPAQLDAVHDLDGGLRLVQG
jgi:hypothetical protein